jgi:cytoskeletal protein RodZ
MKRILALLVTIGAGVGGFLWWKRRQVIAANEVSADPWPSAVAPVQTPVQAPVQDAVETKSNPKKSTPKKRATKKATQDPE